MSDSLINEFISNLESNMIHQIDCLEGMKLIQDKSIDMILCDLPYGTTRNKWDSVISLDLLWFQYERIIKDNGAIVLTAQTPFDKVLGSSNLKLLRYEWIWDKKQVTGFLNSKKMPLKRHENVLVFYKKLPIYNPQFSMGNPYEIKRNHSTNNYGSQKENETKSDGRRYPTSLLEIPQIRQKNGHPTQKPVELFEYLIKTYTNEGDLVLDNCMGSGTTAVACILNNREWIGFETDSKYIEMANKRLSTVKSEININKQ